MVIATRPHRVGGLVEPRAGLEAPHRYVDRFIRLPLPDRYTTVMLEAAMLIALARLADARRCFEFGTLRGVTTLNLAANLNPGTRIYTLDLAPQPSLAYRNTPYAPAIQQLIGDSTRFDFGPYEGRMDFVFVDGGHDYATARSDTENAFRLWSDRPLSCIAWHDYGNPDYPDVTRLLDELSRERPIFHIGRTMLCFTFRDAPREVLDALAGPEADGLAA